MSSTKADIKLDEKSSAYIDARFDAIKEDLDTSTEANKGASSEFGKAAGRKDDSQPNWRKKREDSMLKTSEAWKLPIGKTATK